MKLYVWKYFSPGGYTDGIAFAIAEDEQKAIELVIEEHGWNPSDWGGDPEVFPVDQEIAFSRSGGD